MPYGHEFYPQPRGNPPWCFCRRRDCPGWAAYLAWYQDHTGEQGEPGDQVTEAHSCLSKVIATLVSRYSALSGSRRGPEHGAGTGCHRQDGRAARVTHQTGPARGHNSAGGRGPASARAPDRTISESDELPGGCNASPIAGDGPAGTQALAGRAARP